MVVLKNVKTLLVVTVAAVMMDTNWRMTITLALILTSVPLIMEDVNNIVIILLAAIVVLVLRDTTSLAIIMNVKVLSEYLHSNLFVAHGAGNVHVTYIIVPTGNLLSAFFMSQIVVYL